MSSSINTSTSSIVTSDCSSCNIEEEPSLALSSSSPSSTAGRKRLCHSLFVMKEQQQQTTSFHVGRRSFPSDKCMRLPFDDDDDDNNDNNKDARLSTSESAAASSSTTCCYNRNRSTSSDILTIQKLDNLMNTLQKQDHLDCCGSEVGSSSSPYHKKERYSEPSLSTSILFEGSSTSSHSGYSKFFGLRDARSNNGKASHDETTSSTVRHGSSESRSRVMDVLGRASQIINNIEPSTTSGGASATNINDEPAIFNNDNIQIIQSHCHDSTQRRCGVFNLCNTITMEHEVLCKDEKCNDNLDDEKINDEPISFTTCLGIRLLEPSSSSNTTTLTTSMMDLTEPSIVTTTSTSTTGRDNTTTTTSTSTTRRDVLTMLRRYNEHHYHNFQEHRQLSSSSCGTTSSNTSFMDSGSHSSNSLSY